MKYLLSLILSVFTLITVLRSQPYPPIKISVKYDKHSKQQYALGSDNFQVTWAYDDHISMQHGVMEVDLVALTQKGE
jgi:hypothetical protein